MRIHGAGARGHPPLPAAVVRVQRRDVHRDAEGRGRGARPVCNAQLGAADGKFQAGLRLGAYVDVAAASHRAAARCSGKGTQAELENS